MLTPFTHQKEMLVFHSSYPNTLDNSEVGTGKTGPIVVWLQKMFKQAKITKALVVCPNSILENWVKEIEMWSDLDHIVLRGTKLKRLILLQEFQDWIGVYLINY